MRLTIQVREDSTVGMCWRDGFPPDVMREVCCFRFVQCEGLLVQRAPQLLG